MTGRSRPAAALALALALTLAGCGPEGGETPGPAPSPALPAAPSPTASARAQTPFTLPLDPGGSWDPYAGVKSGNMSLAPLLYESLYALDSRFEPHPLLAQGARVSEDGLTWTLTLRDGITFSDGEPLTAQAAGEALNAARGEKSLYAKRLRAVRKVSWEKEGLVLTVELTAPNSKFPALLDFPIARVTEEGTLGTGPYVLEGAFLRARGDWWRGLALPLSAIPLREIRDADALVAAFDAGELGLVSVDPTGADALGYSIHCQTWEYPTTTMVYLGFQCAQGPCRQAGFRRAVSQGVNREDLADQALEGHAVTAALPAHPASSRYDAALAGQVSYDPLAAAAALEELGCRMGEDGVLTQGREPVTLTLLVNSDNLYKEKLARAIAEDLMALGIRAEVKALSWEEYEKALEKGRFDLYLGECRLTGDLDPGPFLDKDSGLGYGVVASRELTGAYEAARATGDWAEFDGKWAGELPIAPLCFKNAQVLTQWGRVEGLCPTQGNLFYGLENWIVR